MAKPILLWLCVGLPSCQQPITTEIVDTLASKAALRLHKQLLQSIELNRFHQLDHAAHQLIQANCQRSFGAVHLLKDTHHLKVIDRGLNLLKHDWRIAINNLMLAYPALIAADKKHLKDLFNVTDYPTADNLRQSFYFRWQII